MVAKRVNVGLLGCGVVGSGLVELIRRNGSLVAERSGVELNVRRVLVRDLHKPRNVEPSLLTVRPEAVIGAEDIDVVVELIGGVEPARSFIRQALTADQNVVTANKALLAESGGDLFRLAAQHHRRIGFEASVCAGIPLIRALQHGLAGDTIHALFGIVNGTNNFILTRMAEDGLSFDAAVKLAQARGFCEADPSLDVDGRDAAQKLVLLSEIAFGASVALADVPVEGIRSIAPEDLQAARDLGYAIKHLAIAREVDGALGLRVQPTLLPLTHPLASVRDEYNAVLLHGDAVGDMIFEGKGAGSLPTASAVLADIIDAARERREHDSHVAPSTPRLLVDEGESPAYMRFPILDLPGVIGLITTVLGNHGVSIRHASASLTRERREDGRKTGNVTILAHHCADRTLQRAVDQIARLPILTGKPVILRVLGETPEP